MKTLFYVAHTCLLLIGVVGTTYAQREIPLINPSFEGVASMGGSGAYIHLDGWIDIGRIQFPVQSPFDVHSASSNIWHVEVVPQDGETFIGLVVRPDGTWERIGQELETPLEKDHKYELTLFLCRSPVYLSRTMNSRDTISFTQPALIAIWGANKPANDDEFLARSLAVTSADWEEYRFILEPKNTCIYLIIEAYYLRTTTEAYAGHVLIDNARLVELE
jgi:hypothetical protein